MEDEQVRNQFADIVYRDAYGEEDQKLIEVIAKHIENAFNDCDLVLPENHKPLFKMYAMMFKPFAEYMYNKGLFGEDMYDV